MTFNLKEVDYCGAIFPLLDVAHDFPLFSLAPMICCLISPPPLLILKVTRDGTSLDAFVSSYKYSTGIVILQRIPSKSQRAATTQKTEIMAKSFKILLAIALMVVLISLVSAGGKGRGNLSFTFF
jgi:hypothetical protein